ncbi:hypothetical protein HAX54_003187 [Datura stramonium]|uniref:Uncharacterized protein n=1 Tax=Datura stramonium TaxID=4076 RepID=A0ABS8T6G5_DATST|nr:hypothetical protein [Datura stramonium]
MDEYGLYNLSRSARNKTGSILKSEYQGHMKKMKEVRIRLKNTLALSKAPQGMSAEVALFEKNRIFEVLASCDASDIASNIVLVHFWPIRPATSIYNKLLNDDWSWNIELSDVDKSALLNVSINVKANPIDIGLRATDELGGSPRV